MFWMINKKTNFLVCTKGLKLQGFDSPLYILRGYRLYFPNNTIFFSFPEDFSDCSSSTDPDEMPHNVPFYLGLQNLSKYPFTSLDSTYTPS